MKLETNTKIETIYDFLDESGYPYLSNDEEYKEKQFEVDYNGLKLIVTRSNNMDADEEQLIPNTFSYFIKVGGRVINNSAKDVPKILDYLKSRYADGGLTKKKETDKKDLVALHNISPYQIIEADKLGGMVTPSIAILKAGERYTDFGEITLIADKDLINPENSSVRVFSGDVYSPSVPNKLYVISPELEKKGRELSVKAYSSKYRDFGGAISNLIQDYGSVYKDMGRLPKDELIAKYYEDLRLVYLIDKGIDFEIPYEDKEQYLWGNQQFTLTKEQKERAKDLLKKHSEETVGSSRDISKETTKGFYDLYWEVVFDIQKKNFEEFKDEEVDIRELSEKMTKDRYKALFEKYIGDESWISNFYIDKLSDIVSAKQVINKSELANSIKSEFTPEVEADYKKWVDDFMNRYQGSEYFEKGNKKIPYNLENLVEATTGSVRGVEKNLTYSQNKAKSFSSKEFKSIEDIKKSKDKLVSKEQMNLIDEENKEAFLELYDRLNYEWESSWKGLDSLAMAVADFYKGKSASQALQKNDFKNPTNHQITIFEDFAKKLKNSPVDYFEAKIQRAVLLSEFNYAVVPSEGYPKVIDEVVKILEKSDLQVYYYNPNVAKDRMKVVNSIVRKDKSLKFDMGGQAPDVIINPTEIECHNCHWKWEVKDGGADLFICHKCNYDNTKFYKFEGLEGQKIIQSISYAKGGRTIAQTPAPKKDQIKGSDKNKEGSSKDLKSAKKIELSDSTIEAIKNKVNKHNEEYPKKKITIDSAKAVVRRGMGAYSSSYRPTISGGKPNSRVAWGLARLNAFIYKIIKGTSKSGKYSQDNDLIEELGYKVKKYADGGLAIDQYTSEKIKKAFVSIRIRYESGRAEDDKFFNKYELKSFDQKPFEELKDHKLKGILGVSTSNYNLSEWLVHRECLVVMPFDKFKEMNDTEQVQYYDADYLSKNGFDSLHRLYDRKERTDEDYRSVLQNVFPKIAMEFNLEAMVTQYSNLYAVEYWFNVYNSSRFIDYVSKQKRIDSPEELAQIVVDYSKSEQSVTDYYYQKPAKELTVESIIKPITNGIVSSGRIYVDESEWLIKNKELVIPENSQLFFVIKDYENMRDKYEEIISQYDLRSSYKIGFINQKNLNDLQSSRFRLKDLKWKGEYEKARTNTEKKILKALKNIQSNIIEDWTNKIIDDFKETYSDSVYSDYDGNEYSTNILEVPSAIIYFDSLMLKFIEIYDSYIDSILKTKNRYSFSYIFNDFYTYLDDLLKYSNEEADDLEVSTPYNRIYKSDMIQKLRYFVRNTDNYSKLGEQIKTEVGSDLYRYFTKDEIGFKDGGEVKYIEVIKGEKSILKARVQKGDASLTGSMIDSLVDKGYKIKEVSKEDYDKFDYSNVDTEDLNEFVSSWDMFN